MNIRTPNPNLDRERKREMPQLLPSCEECGTTENDVLYRYVWYTAWGRNSFDFNWSKNQGVMALCENCDEQGYITCCSCGAAVDSDHYGTGYLPDEYDGETICPDCAKKLFSLVYFD